MNVYTGQGAHGYIGGGQCLEYADRGRGNDWKNQGGSVTRGGGKW